MTKVCPVCGSEFSPTTSQKYCSTQCREDHALEYQRVYQYAWAVKTGRIKNPGVGSGGLVGEMEKNPAFKHGLGAVKNRLGPEIKATVKYCEACGKDVSKATQHNWVIHHKDHDQHNNSRENLMLLCKRCHQIHHKCWKHFERATTISQESRTQESSKRPAPVCNCEKDSNGTRRCPVHG